MRRLKWSRVGFMHEHQKLFDEAWRKGGDSIKELLELAQRYMNEEEYIPAAECFRDAAAASKHEIFRYKIEVEKVFHANKRHEDHLEISKTWLQSNRSRLRRYPVALEGFGARDLGEMVSKAIKEPRLQQEVAFLAFKAGEHPSNALNELLYPALGFRGSRLRLFNAELLPAIDNIVDFIENSWRVAQMVEDGVYFQG
jgi:hypothetical protein